MFDKIVTNADPYRGPASGDSGGEFGDNWTDAVRKINGNFAKAAEALEGKGGETSEASAELSERLTAAENVIGEMRAQIEVLTTTVNSMAAFFEPQGEPHAPAETEARVSS